MNQIAKALCLALVAFALSSFSLAEAQRSERAPRQEEAGEQVPTRKEAARKRVLQRLEERGFTKAELKRAKEVMQARREIRREGRAEGQRQRGSRSRAERGGQRRARAEGARGGRRGVQRQRGQRGMRGQRGQRGQRRGMRGGQRRHRRR